MKIEYKILVIKEIPIPKAGNKKKVAKAEIIVPKTPILIRKVN